MNNDFKRLKNFIDSIGTTRILLQRAHEQGFLIEGLVLYSALIDGFCRIALVLKEQIDNKSSHFNIKYIYQDRTDSSYYSERDIYNYAHKNKILEKDLFDEVGALYDVRNKAIHRFIITEIEYSHLGLVLDRYELVFQRLWTIVYNLEAEQIQKKVGMTVLEKVAKEDRSKIFKNVIKKIDSKSKKKLLKTLGPKLINDASQFSEVFERNRISEEISYEMEIQEEKKKIPHGFRSVKEITKWGERKGFFKKCICGHLKINHIDMKGLKKFGEGNIERYFTKCNFAKCNCKKYEE